PLVDERMQQPVEYLRVRDRPSGNAELAGDALDELEHRRIREARASLVAVVALAGLLPEPPRLHEALENGRPALVPRQAAAPADRKADVVAGEIAHRERPHGEAETLDDAVDLLGCRALLEQELRFRAVVHEHAVADEAVAVAGEHRDLAEGARERHDGREGL